MRYPKLEIAVLTDNTLFHLWIEKGEKKELKLVIFRTLCNMFSSKYLHLSDSTSKTWERFYTGSTGHSV